MADATSDTAKPANTPANTKPAQTDADAKAKAADQAEAKARDAEQAAADAAATAADQDKSTADRKADEAAQKADDARAEAEAAKRDADAGNGAATTAVEAKADSAVLEPERAVGDHLAQRFSNTPANPQLAPGLDPDEGAKVKLLMTTSDSIARGEDDVCFVHEEMVGDYLRAGWRRAPA